MQSFEFTAEEVEVLSEMLEHEKREIDREVLRTRTRDFKEMLKRRREALEALRAKFAKAAIAA